MALSGGSAVRLICAFKNPIHPETHHAGLLDGLAGPDADLGLIGVGRREDHQALGVAHLHHEEDSEQGHGDDDVEDPQKFGTFSRVKPNSTSMSLVSLRWRRLQ